MSLMAMAHVREHIPLVCNVSTVYTPTEDCLHWMELFRDGRQTGWTTHGENRKAKRKAMKMTMNGVGI